MANDTIRVRDDGRVIQRPRFDRVFTIFLPANQSAEEVIERLESLPSVIYAEKHMDASLTNDPQYPAQWHLNNTGQAGGTPGADISAEQAWQIFTGSSDIKIGIFDTGVDLSHNEFTGKISGDNISSTGTEFEWSHGTHVAGIAAARANNSHSGRGVDWNAQVVSKQIFNGHGNFLGNTTVVNKIMDAVDNDGVHVLNNSWRSTSFSSTVRQAFAYAYMMNRVSTAAMGNDFNAGNPTAYPAAFGQGVIAVGATQNNDARSVFSQTGNHIRVVAPGGFGGFPPNDARDILSTLRNNNTGFIAGTSMATPQVSGIASLLKGYNPNLYNDDIQQIIQLSADKVAGMSGQNWTQEYGFGRVNAYEALKRLQSPYVLNHHSVTGGTVHSSSGNYTKTFLNVPGLASGNYIVRRHDVRRTVNFSWLDEPAVWGRGVASHGYSAANPNFGISYSDAVSVSNSSATLRTFVYQVWTISGQYLGYYPTIPSNVEFAYTVHGIPGSPPPPPPTVSISGPSNMFEGTSDTFTANVSGGTPPYSYQWYYRHETNPNWIPTGTNSSIYNHTAGPPNGEFVRVVVTDSYPNVNEDTHYFTIIGMGFSQVNDNENTFKPDAYALSQNYPNPFNPSTVIRYDLPEQSEVVLQVFDIMGRIVATLESSTKSAGRYTTTFDASSLSSGLYIARLRATGISGEAFIRELKMQLIK